MYVIHVYEQIYGGLHGIEDWVVEDCVSEEDAADYAHELSCQLMESYDSVMAELRQAVEDEINFRIEYGQYTDNPEEMSQDLLDEAMSENVAYDLYEICDDCEYTVEEINKLLVDDPEDFWCQTV